MVETLLSFCAIVNATQLIHKPPTRVTSTESSSSLLDVILFSDPVLVKSSGVIEITISDQFLVDVVINLRPPKQAPTYIVTRSFRNYKADQFANDFARIPWNTMNLMDESVDNSLDAFNDLLLACLDDHAPIKTVKIGHKPNPFITEDIRDLIRVRGRLHKRASRTGMREDWEVLKELRNRVKFVLRKAERQQICENQNNSGTMWKTNRSALPNKSSRPSFTKDTYTCQWIQSLFYICGTEGRWRLCGACSPSRPTYYSCLSRFNSLWWTVWLQSNN